MQSANRLQKALKTGRPSFGAWQTLPGPNLSRTIARTPGLDWVCVDCEHGNLSDSDMHESVAAIAACGVSPVVRVPDGQHWMIKRALDTGAHGIMVPLLRSVEDAKNVVKYCKFPPEGTRGLGSPFAMEKFVDIAQPKDIPSYQYFKEANSSIVIIVQIETASALEQVNEIAAVPGIDVCFVGPIDLGNAIGHPVDTSGVFHDELKQAVQKIHDAAQAAGKKSAIYTSAGPDAKKYADMGFNMINTMLDVAAIRIGFGRAVATAYGK